MLDILILRLYLNIKMKHADVLFVPLEKYDSQIIKFPNDTNESTFFRVIYNFHAISRYNLSIAFVEKKRTNRK